MKRKGKKSQEAQTLQIKLKWAFSVTTPTPLCLCLSFQLSLSMWGQRIQDTPVSLPQVHMSFQVVLWCQLEAEFLERERKQRNKGITEPAKSCLSAQSSHTVKTCLSAMRSGSLNQEEIRWRKRPGFGLEGLEIKSILLCSSLVWGQNDWSWQFSIPTYPSE